MLNVALLCSVCILNSELLLITEAPVMKPDNADLFLPFDHVFAPACAFHLRLLARLSNASPQATYLGL